MSSSWFFYYQTKGGEEHWKLELAEKREAVTRDTQPAFVSVLDLSSVPDDNDWSKVRYRGPLYFDFDADGDLDLVCDQFKNFLGKLDSLGFDISQARLYLSGGKGMHVEIPQECFLPKVPANGTPWLPYVYRAMAESIVVDTMDLRVYTGKRGRMWRTPGVKRENGNYKVAITLEDALTITPELYVELISAPSPAIEPAPSSCNSSLAMLFERSKEKVVTQMRGKKKRQAAANAFLEPWKKAKRHPPTIEALMAGENVLEGAGFQQLSMQLSIYATSVGMSLEEYLERCRGLCEKHVSDSRRYATVAKRREELARMWRYMEENTLYEFDPAPVAALVKKGVPVVDLGVMDKEDHEDTPAEEATHDAGDGETATDVVQVDLHKGVRKGFFMNGDGMFKKEGDVVVSLCRATFRKVESFFDVERKEFKGFEFDLCVKGSKTTRQMLGAEAFTSAASMKKFFVAHQLSFQGGDPETTALLDIVAEKARRGGRIYTYPREGFFIIDNPESDDKEPVKVYLTQHEYQSSVKEEDENYFRLRYRPTQAISSYNIDVHRAPELDDDMVPALHDLFRFNRETEVADLVGWFVACHYRSAYLHLFRQFPLLQIYGEAGAGKSQTVLTLARLHWYMTDVSIKSAMSCTPFAMDAHASSSTSAPFILDEFKPRELRKIGGRYEKLKDVLKACYIGADIGERGTVNRGAESNLAIVKSKATAPIVFMGEAIEMETAIIERSVCVNLSKSFQTKARQDAFHRLEANGTALSALGREIVQMGFALNLPAMREEVRAIQASIEARMPNFDDDTKKRAAPRMIFNRAVVVHALRTLQKILARRYGSEFDDAINGLLSTKSGETAEQAKMVTVLGMSEISKVINRIAALTREIDQPYEVRLGKDYAIGDGWVDMKVDKAYDQYRRYCAAIHDTPLFDTVETFSHAINSYSPCIDKHCVSSELNEDGNNERVVRFDSRRLMKEGVNSFRS